MRRILPLTIALLLASEMVPTAQRTVKPPLHGRHWVAITGKPLGATAGAMMFQKGGNAVDAACAMLGAVATMWDTLSWGGETQALIYNPHTKKVVGINALGVAPTGATPEFYRQKGMKYPPEYGPLAAVTPGTPGGLMVMLAEFGTLTSPTCSRRRSRWPTATRSRPQAADAIERQKKRDQEVALLEGRLPAACGTGPRRRRRAGEIFKQADLAATLRKLVDAERQALAAGKNRKEAIYAAYDRFYRGDIAQEFVRGRASRAGSTRSRTSRTGRCTSKSR